MPNFKPARHVMTPNPVSCAPDTTVDEVARLMLENDCGEIPVIGPSNRPIGVITDRDIVCRIIAQGKNPVGWTAEACMTQPAITVAADDPLDEVVSVMEKHKIRRVPVVDELGRCTGIVSQADVALCAQPREVAELVRAISRDEPSQVLVDRRAM